MGSPVGSRIATLAAHIHAAEHQLLVLLAEFDPGRGWEMGDAEHPPFT